MSVHEPEINPFEVMRVHVDNIGDLHVVRTEEHEPEHYVFITWVIAAAVAGGEVSNIGNEPWAQVLQLNPRRKSFSIASPDGAMILCHSETQARDPQNYVSANPPFPQGAFYPQGSTASLDGTGRVWVANPNAIAIRIAIVQNIRGEG